MITRDCGDLNTAKGILNGVILGAGFWIVFLTLLMIL